MVMTNTEILQIAIDSFGIILCLISAMVLVVNGKNKITTGLFGLFLANIAMLVFDGCAYLFRGNTNMLGIGMTRTSNFFCFLLQPVMVFMAIRLIYRIIEDCGITPSRVFEYVSGFASVMAVLILIISQFNGSMYYFDDYNFYHRANGWYIYAILLIFAMFIEMAMVFSYFKKLPRPLTNVLILAYLVPLFFTCLQLPLYGYSLTNAGVAVGLLLAFVGYLRKDLEVKKNQGENDIHERNLVSTIIIFLITIVCMSASLITCVRAIQNIADKNAKQGQTIMVQMIEASISKEILSPITVARTMTQNPTLISLLKTSDAESVKSRMVIYLGSIYEQFSYPMVFAVSDISKAYYNYNGIEKTVDPETDIHDIWYQNFIDSPKTLELNVDTDEANNWDLTLFVNARVIDYDETVGVCGVGISVADLEAILKEYEDQYGVEIHLTDGSGTIRISPNEEEINKEKEDTTHFKEARSDIYFEESREGTKIINYIPELNWYVVIRTRDYGVINIGEIIFPSIMIFSLGLIIMGAVFWLVFSKGRVAERELQANRKVSNTDELTGIYNRRSYEEDIRKLEEEGKGSDLILVMMDVNGLKMVNDSMGHDAGDEYLVGAADCLMAGFSQYGKVYRTGGDEFVCLLNCTKEELEAAFEQFDSIRANWKGSTDIELSVSRGYAALCEHPEMSVKELEKLADKYMYEDKNEYYRRTGKERRMSW